MGVLDRLRRITGEDKEASRKKEDRSAELQDLRGRVEAIMARRPQEQPRRAKMHPPLEELIAGEEIVSEAGAFFLASQRRPGDHLHGNRSLGDSVRLNMETAALLANNRVIAGCRISEGLFLDTETTGLSGGTGTLAFMIGLGFFEDDTFVTRQIFLRDFSEERAALQYLNDIVRSKRFLVTFNGKAFDVNLLAARYIMNKLRNPLDDLPHLDLLFPSRRLCGHRLENSRLATLEKALFGLQRDDDIPGMEIPARYFSWLRRRDPQLVADIFRHNHLDILSLAVLATHLSGLLTSCPLSPGKTDPRDLLAAARLLVERNEQTQAIGLLRDLITCEELLVRSEARKTLSLILKRQGDWEAAALLWEALLRENPTDLFAAVELAKWHEHGCRNYRAAYELVSRLLEGSTAIHGPEREALQHRQRRLQSRLTAAASA